MLTKYNKPTLKKIEEKANKLFLYLKAQDDYVSKAQIGAVLGIENERSVRDVISLLATKVPIISHSKTKGYKIAKSEKDLDEAYLTWRELTSRANEINNRILPLLKFCEKYRPK